MNYDKIAKTIVKTNLSIAADDLVIISAGPKSAEFAEALAYYCSMVGAQPVITYSSNRLALRIYRDIKEKFLRNKPKFFAFTSKKADVSIALDESEPAVEKQIPQDKVEVRRKTIKPLRDLQDARLKRKDMRAALIGFPTEEEAKAMGISFGKLNKIFWGSININYDKLYQHNNLIIKKLKDADKIRIIGKKTDLEFSIKNRPLLNDCGMVSKKDNGFLNLPAGEVFVAPLEHSANGEIYFDLPCMWHFGKQVKGVWFKFKNGKVVDYKIEKGLQNFEDVIKNASGEKLRIAELGIGTNPKAKPTGGMIIVDEKVKGTIHIAIGSNKLYYGKNESTIHWDFFKDMKNGKIFVDEKLFMKNGKIVV